MEKEKQPTNDREGLVNVLQRARQVVLCAHVSPDGDTIGSCLALRLALQRLGKEAAVICQDKVPNTLSSLPGADSILRPEKLNVAHPELALCVDVSDQRRLGSCIRVVEGCPGDGADRPSRYESLLHADERGGGERQRDGRAGVGADKADGRDH